MNERQAWVALAATRGVGDVTFRALLARFGSAHDALKAVVAMPSARADPELARLVGTRSRAGLARRIRAAAADPEWAPRRMEALGGWLLTPLDESYPAHLHAIEEPPPVIYGLGDPASLQGSRIVAVVGTRRPTGGGRDLAARVAARLAQAGAVVVSGLAVGIDGAAHMAALEAGGLTVAVLGSGVDAPGPARHRRLASHIAAQGAVISELAPGVRATTGTFPRRNRIISGLATGTVVIEAPRRSGSLITARHALEQGRQLVVAPGRPLDGRVAGCLALLRETPARVLAGLDELVADLALDQGVVTGEGRPARQLSPSGALDLLPPTQRTVATALAQGPDSVDGLCRSTGLDAGVVAASLTMLQLRGWARVYGATQLPAGPLARMDKQAQPVRESAEPTAARGSAQRRMET